jgi:hypothetical protein
VNRKSHHVIRQRQTIGVEKLGLTLSRRHPGRFIVSVSKTGGKQKFEEDIKASKIHDFISLHRLSGKKIDVASSTRRCIQIFDILTTTMAILPSLRRKRYSVAS